MLAPEKRRGLRFDGHLQHVTGEPTDEPDHRPFDRCRRAAMQHAVDLFLQLNARWYSLHGVDLLRPRANGAVSGLVTRRIPTPLAFTGSLGRHPTMRSCAQDA